MSNLVSFPSRNVEKIDPLVGLKKQIQQRFGVSLKDYMGSNGKRSEETQMKVDRALYKETLQVASKLIEA